MPQCKNCQKEFVIRDQDRQFYNKIDVPPPTHCPDCRAQRRMAWRNERTLYAGQCGLCHKPMISMYSPTVKFPVYCIDCWYGDSWDARDYGRDFNFSEPLLPQLFALQQVAPHLSLVQVNNVNCDYINFGVGNKDCYLSFSTLDSEGILYCLNTDKSKDLVDCEDSLQCELLYNSLNCERCFNGSDLVLCSDCTDCQFCYNCSNCEKCFLCFNLRNKSYYWLNEKITAEEYDRRMKEISGSFAQRQKAKTDLARLLVATIRRYAVVKNCLNAIGDYLYNSKNLFQCFRAYDSEDCAYSDRSTHGTKDAYDCYANGVSEKTYEVIAGVGSYENYFVNYCSYGANNQYSMDCPYAKNTFGCASAHHQKYCILNKQYSEEEYKKLLPKIIHQAKKTSEYGEFFPAVFSPFGYNETVAQEYFPLTREATLARSWYWQDNLPGTKGLETLKVLPDNIEEAPVNLIKEILACASCGKNYKVTAQEFIFYQKQNLPLPRKCSDCRHFERTTLRNPRKLYYRQCMCENSVHGHAGQCKNELETTYSPDRSERIFCEDCYQKEIY